MSLLERLRRPDDCEAWNRFVELYTPLIFAWARQVGLQESDAADLVQDVFALLITELSQKTVAFKPLYSRSFSTFSQNLPTRPAEPTWG